MQLSDFTFDLPNELIAQHPCEPRDHSRLMIVNRQEQSLTEIPFYELPQLLQAGDQLIFNDTKVIPARLKGKRPSGGAVEFLLSKPLSNGQWEAMARPGKKLKPGARVSIAEDFEVEVLETFESGTKRIALHSSLPIEQQLERYGEMPLPPYIERKEKVESDGQNYQTIYAQNAGAVAAPTAGLHFTESLFAQLDAKEVEKIMVTLHVGLGTFKPVQVDQIEEHRMHSEVYHVSSEAAEKLNKKTASKRICVGTTCCRVLESCTQQQGQVQAGSGSTDIFIYPGYEFRYVDALLTNFHLPGSTLLMLVSALAGYDLALEAYRKAVREKFRFFSYGDAMLIL